MDVNLDSLSQYDVSVEDNQLDFSQFIESSSPFAFDSQEGDVGLGIDHVAHGSPAFPANRPANSSDEIVAHNPPNIVTIEADGDCGETIDETIASLELEIEGIDLKLQQIRVGKVLRKENLLDDRDALDLMLEKNALKQRLQKLFVSRRQRDNQRQTAQRTSEALEYLNPLPNDPSIRETLQSHSTTQEIPLLVSSDETASSTLHADKC